MERGGGTLLGSAGVAVVRAVGDTIGGSVPLGSAEVVVVGLVEGVFGGGAFLGSAGVVVAVVGGIFGSGRVDCRVLVVSLFRLFAFYSVLVLPRVRDELVFEGGFYVVFGDAVSFGVV